MESLFLGNRDFFVKAIGTQSDDPEKVVSVTKSKSLNALDTAVCARIRPLSAEETGKGLIAGIKARGEDSAILFELKKKVNGAPGVNDTLIKLHHVFGPEEQTSSAYDRVVRQLVPWVWGGGIGTLFAYGQTGSGKTYTVTEITRLIARDLISNIEESPRKILVCAFELMGNRAFDLLEKRKPFSILEDSFGAVQLAGIREVSITTDKGFLALVNEAASLRSTQTTLKNDQSSRSHAVYRIRVINQELVEVPDGAFFLVDLAGSEGSNDTAQHTSERMSETREINASLSILKDCIRGRAQWSAAMAAGANKHIHVPFRSSKLTSVLKFVFDTKSERACKTVVIACVAPGVLDVPHGKNTLRYAEMLKVPVPKAKPRALDKNAPATWTNAFLKEWIARNSGKPAVDPAMLAPTESGMQLLRLPQGEFINRCLKTLDYSQDHALAFYQKLWMLHVGSRSASSAPDEEEDKERDESTPSTPWQTRVKPAMFVRMGTIGGLYGSRVYMILAPAEEPAADPNERGYVCAEVTPGLYHGTYELRVQLQRTIKLKMFTDEVLMEYDDATRYYYLCV